MMERYLQFGFALLSTAWLLAPCALAQGLPPQERPAPLRRPAKKVLPRRAPSPTDLLERLQKLTPEQREAVFEAMPEERRAAVRRRFDAFNKLSADERDRLGENLLVFLNLGPQRQELARAMFRRFAGFAKDRQESMRSEMKVMADLSPEDRRSRVNADEFRNRFSADEKLLMFDMLRVFPGRRVVLKPESIQQ
jgi:DNA-binding MarR family transcriptional regulator